VHKTAQEKADNQAAIDEIHIKIEKDIADAKKKLINEND
jgi:hypothetical protein